MASKITRGKIRKPLAMVLYGPPGLGKSSFASGFDDCVFVGAEENDELDSARFPVCKTYNEFIKYLDELINGMHNKENFKTIVIDTIDSIEKLIHKEICDSEFGKTMATARKGFGKAYIEADGKLWEIRERLKTLRDKCHFNIIILGHSIKSKFSDPMLGIDYDTYQMCLHIGKQVDANTFFTEWASTVLFINDMDYKDENGKHAVSSGVRQLLTTNKPSHLAKNRFNLPEVIDLVDTQNHEENVGILIGYINEFYNSGAKVNTESSDIVFMQKKIKELINNLKNQQLVPAIESSYMQYENDLDGLTNIKNRLDEIIEEESKNG